MGRRSLPKFTFSSAERELPLSLCRIKQNQPMSNGFENQILIEPVARLMEEFSRLPGIGPKTASRLVFFLLRAPDQQAHALAEALANLKDNVRFCSRCFNITVTDPCVICSSSTRDQGRICVVEEPLDVLAI